MMLTAVEWNGGEPRSCCSGFFYNYTYFRSPPGGIPPVPPIQPPELNSKDDKIPDAAPAPFVLNAATKQNSSYSRAPTVDVTLVTPGGGPPCLDSKQTSAVEPPLESAPASFAVVSRLSTETDVFLQRDSTSCSSSSGAGAILGDNGPPPSRKEVLDEKSASPDCSEQELEESLGSQLALDQSLNQAACPLSLPQNSAAGSPLIPEGVAGGSLQTGCGPTQIVQDDCGQRQDSAGASCGGGPCGPGQGQIFPADVGSSGCSTGGFGAAPSSNMGPAGGNTAGDANCGGNNVQNNNMLLMNNNLGPSQFNGMGQFQSNNGQQFNSQQFSAGASNLVQHADTVVNNLVGSSFWIFFVSSIPSSLDLVTNNFNTIFNTIFKVTNNFNTIVPGFVMPTAHGANMGGPNMLGLMGDCSYAVTK